MLVLARGTKKIPRFALQQPRSALGWRAQAPAQIATRRSCPTMADFWPLCLIIDNAHPSCPYETPLIAHFCMENTCTNVNALAFVVPLAVAGVLVVCSFCSQLANPASYGKFNGANASETAKWEKCGLIPQRLGHILSDAGPTLCGFAACYCALLLAGAPNRNTAPAASVTLASLWLLHYFHRGLVHPLLMRYRAASVPTLITVAGLFPNSLFSWLNAATIACLDPSISQTWHADPRFGVGVAIYILGFAINRASDWKLRSLRSDQQSTVYHVPHGGLFTYVSCANYFGELVQWAGWALASWSWTGLLWWLFALSTFIPRARQTHAWYCSTFPEYPTQRKALIPFIW